MAAAEHPLRLVGLAVGDPADTRSASGAAKFMLDALERRHPMVARRGVEMTRAQRLLAAVPTFHPDRERWKTRFYWKYLIPQRARSANSKRVLAGIDEPFDFVVQIFGMFQTRGAPYVIYIDNTAELSRRHWPEWVDVEGRTLERVYDWERALYGDALHVFAQGTPHARSVVDFYGVPEDRVSVVGGGANFETLPALPDGPRDQTVLFVGRDWTRKGGPMLLDAFREVRGRVPGARLQVVGTDEPASEEGIEVLGTIDDRSRIAELYASAGIFCLPSLYDPYGLSISEAMAYGLPCVITRVGALDEVVMEDETGLIIAPGDRNALVESLVRLLENPDEARRMGAAGRRRVETHQNWDAAAERWEPGLVAAAALMR